MTKKRKVAATASKKRAKKNPVLKEVADVTEELERILSEFRTSTVSYSRERIEKVITRLKALGER